MPIFQCHRCPNRKSRPPRLEQVADRAGAQTNKQSNVYRPKCYEEIAGLVVTPHVRRRSMTAEVIAKTDLQTIQESFDRAGVKYITQYLDGSPTIIVDDKPGRILYEFSKTYKFIRTRILVWKGL